MPLPPRNLLADEASPYLRQHKDNPVHWRPWSPAALAEARELDRPILLSVGYAACHWCHVMAHESFEDQDVASVMNRLFINIKVDREERPDVDQIFMSALTATGEQGGWPLTMFLTPAGKPFWGGTYFPRTARYGRPGFIDVMETLNRAWLEKREEISKSADALTAHVATQLARQGAGEAAGQAMLPVLAERIGTMIDHERGGLRGAPKFPNAPFMRTLWQSWLSTGERDHRDAVLISLRSMLNGGIYDHLGGGLARYSTDADWLVPHFEKMLYDNAQLIQCAGWAYAETGEELFRVRIEETIAWLLREMRSQAGAFTSSLDADSEGEEGLFYTWDRSEIESILGMQTERFLSVYELAAPAGWEGKPILRPRTDTIEADTADLAAMRARLLDARAARIRPGRDDKTLVDWNGLAIAALAGAGRQFERKDWISAAQAAFRSVTESVDADGRLPHAVLGSRRLYPAMSSDYAAMISAAIALYEATRETAYVEQASKLAALLDEWYGDEAGTGHYLTASDSADVPIRIRGDIDEAIPSATGMIIEALARLAAVTGDPGRQSRAWAIAEAATNRAAGQPYGQAGIVNASAMANEPVKLVLVDDLSKPSFVPVANRNPDPRRVDVVVAVGATSGITALADGVLPPTGRPAAYLCVGPTCLAPVFKPSELEDLLRPTAG